jgi:hypothetical protein
LDRAEFYKLPIICGGGHEHYESLARLVSIPVVRCEICGQPIEVLDQDRSWAHRIIEDFKKIKTQGDAFLSGETVFVE